MLNQALYNSNALIQYTQSSTLHVLMGYMVMVSWLCLRGRRGGWGGGGGLI